MSQAKVRAWRDALRDDLPRAPATGLSPQGLALVVGHALDALSDDALARACDVPGTPWERAVVVAARTVVTAPVEWLALLLAHGTPTVLKTPRGEPGLAPWFVAHADAVGLPLTTTDDRAAASQAPLVVAMGDDATIDHIRARLAPGARLLGFGSRFSAAWLPDPDDAPALARDLAAHDGRGCMSPAIVLTDAPDRVRPALAAAMRRAEEAWPRGSVHDAEHAALRSRAALARATGSVDAGPAWSVHRLPAVHATPVSLPRSVQLVAVPDVAAAVTLLTPWRRALSTLGLPRGADARPWAALGSPRVAELGSMQAPPLVRAHDGVAHLPQLVRPPP